MTIVTLLMFKFGRFPDDWHFVFADLPMHILVARSWCVWIPHVGALSAGSSLPPESIQVDSWSHWPVALQAVVSACCLVVNHHQMVGWSHHLFTAWSLYHTSSLNWGGVLPYFVMVGRFCGDDPIFFNFQFDWVPILYLNTIRLTPSFCRKHQFVSITSSSRDTRT